MDRSIRAGIQPDTLAEVFGAGTAQNTTCDKICPVTGIAPKDPSNNGYKGGFRIQFMTKDFELAMDMARRVGARNVLGSSGFGIFSTASEAPDCKDSDARVVFRFLGGNENWKK
jgi:3-hydroxyisobutyrate dehydrogenase